MLPSLPSMNSYGGVIRNYSEVQDPTVEEAAIYRNRYVADIAMMARTSAQAMASFTGQTGADPIDPASGFIHEAMWGTDPAYKPTKDWSATGIVDLTWPTEVDDPLTDEDEVVGGGETHTLNFRRATAFVESSDGTFRAASAKVTGPNTVRVYTYLGTALDDLDGETITVVVW